MQTTPNAISILYSSPHLQTVNLTVLANNIKLKQDNMMCFDLSDGCQTAKAFIDLAQHSYINFTKTHQPLTQVQFSTYMITITRHTYHEYNGKKMIEVLNIRNQQSTNQRQKLQLIHVNEDVVRQVQNEQIAQNNTRNSMSNITFNKNQPEEEMIQLQISDQEQLEVISEQKLKQFQKISDLFAGFPNWQILVRVLDSQYKEFESKAGKQTQLLNLMLIDKTGLKIQTSSFGQNALVLSQKIKIGSVYRISNGLIKQHSYNSNLPEDQSKLTILFNHDTKIIEVKDVPIIPNQIEQMISIEQALKQMNFQKSYNVIAVLLQIGEDMQSEKERGKKVFRKNIVVGDPETMQSIECLIWSKKIVVDQNNLFKVICLKNVKLNNYRDKISLTSTFKSKIQGKNYPKWGQYLKRIKDIQFISINSQQQSNKSNKSNQKLSEQRTITDLQNQIRFLQGSESIVSELQVWVTCIKFQGRWFYGACNKCKKAAQSFTRCQICGIYNQVVNNKYMLPVQLTDYTGSLWLTAFDDFGKEIMRGFKLEDLEKVNDSKLKEAAENQLYQQFRVKIMTKKQEGVVRHIVCGKPIPINIQKALKSNLSKIKKAVYE